MEMEPAGNSPYRPLWTIREGVTYLNHGSFGPCPRSVLAARHAWLEQLESEPMDFFIRRLEDHLDAARDKLGKFVGTAGRNLVFVENATVGMNIVARCVRLEAGDEVLGTDHEYGAVQRIWRQACAAASAEFRAARLPLPLTSPEAVIEAVFSQVTPRTRLIVVSHVTSPTAIILPVAALCREARSRGIAVCIDGPHAPAAVDVDIDRLGCDYYTASCHKWLSAPFGSGFLFVHPRVQGQTRPSIVSWGQSLSGRPGNWADEFTWGGTRDPSAFLAVPAAIDFLQELQPRGDATAGDAGGAAGIALFRNWGHGLARLARQRITTLTGLEPIVPDEPAWTSTMIALPLPDSVVAGEPGHMHPLQHALWDEFSIEVPIVNWRDRRYVRVSCHLYNDARDIDRLVEALITLLGLRVS